MLCLLDRSFFLVLFPPYKKNLSLRIKQAFASSFLLDILIVQTPSEHPSGLVNPESLSLP